MTSELQDKTKLCDMGFSFGTSFLTLKLIFFRTSAVFQVITAVTIEFCLLGCDSVKSSKTITKEPFPLKRQ